MRFIHRMSWVFVLGGVVFLASFVGGIVSASDEEGTRLSPWFAVEQAEAIPNMITLLLTYGDFDRGCRCFPRTDDDINANGQCIPTGVTWSNYMAANCNTLPCRNRGSGGGGSGAANYCTDHNAFKLSRFGGSMIGDSPIWFSGGNNRYPYPLFGALPDPPDDEGEFLGFFDWMETVVEDMFAKRIDLVFPMLQTMLCGTTACMTQMGSDLCLVIADGEYGGSNGNVCFQDRSGAEYGGLTVGRANDGIMLWANRAFAKIYPLYDELGLASLRTVVAMYAVRQSYNPNNAAHIDGDLEFRWPPAGVANSQWLEFPYYNTVSLPDGSYYQGVYKGVGSSEVCMEAYMYGGMRGEMRIFLDAMLLRIDMALIMGENPWTGDESLFDLCVTEAQMDFKGARAYGWMRVGGGYPMNCDMEDGEDGGNDLMNMEDMALLHGMLKDMVNEIFHGSCPGSYNFCSRYQANVYGRGADCQAQIEDCIRAGYTASFCQDYGNACAHPDVASPCNVATYNMKWVVNMGNPPIDRWMTLTETERQEKEGHCTYGMLPMDLNNMLNPYQPMGVNMPGYDPFAPTYGMIEFGNAAFDLGVYIDGDWEIASDHVRVDTAVAIRPRWGEYWGCIDTLEMGLPQYTRPAKWEFQYPSTVWNYGIKGEEYDWVSPSLHTKVWDPIVDNPANLASVTVPTFNYYISDFNIANVSDNGFLSLDPAPVANVNAPYLIPNTTAPQRIIAPLWADLDGRSLNVWYEIERIPPQWRDMGGNVVMAGGQQVTQASLPNPVMNDGVITQALGITFTLFETTHSGQNVYISTNGWLTLGTSAPGSYPTPAAIPNTAAPNHFIAPLWADLEIYWKWLENDHPCIDDPCDGADCTDNQYHYFGSGDIRYREITDDTCDGGDCAIVSWNNIAARSGVRCEIVCCNLGDGLNNDDCNDSKCPAGGGDCANPTTGDGDDVCGDNPQEECPAPIPPMCPRTYDLQVVLYDDSHPSLGGCFDINYGDLDALPSPYAAGVESVSTLSGPTHQGFTVTPAPYTYRFCLVPSGSRLYSGGSVYYYHDAVRRRFIFTWDNMKGKASGWYPAYNSFQTILEYGGSGVDDIVFQYKNIVGYDPYSIGVEDAQGDLGRAMAVADDGSAYRFYWQEPKEYKIGLGIAQDFHSEIYQLLHASNFFCWSIDKDFINNLIYDVGSEWGFNLSSLGGMDLTQLGEFFRVPSFAALIPGLEKVADPDGYVSLKFVPSGAPSTRTGVGEYVMPNEGILDLLHPEEQAAPGGLKGDYYQNPDGASDGYTMQNFLFSLDHEDGEIPDYSQGAWPTELGTVADYYSVIWSGYILAPFQTTYTFCGRSDDGQRLLIDNQLIFHWPTDPTLWGISGRGAPAFPGDCGSITLSPGLHPIQYQYYELIGDAEAHLYWCVSEANPYGISQCPVDDAADIISGTYLYSGGASPSDYVGTYDVMAKLPSSSLEVWAPLNDDVQGSAANEMVRLFSVDVMMSIGLDIEYMTEYSKTLRYWGWDSESSGSVKLGTFNNFARIFFGLKPEITGISYAADQRLTRAEMEGAVGSIFATVASSYMNLVVDTKVEFGGAMFIPGGPADEWGLMIRGIYPEGPDSGPLNESQPPLWADNSAGDYMAYYVDIGNDSQMNWDMAKMAMPMVITMLAPPRVSPMVIQPPLSGEAGDEIGSGPVEAYIQAPVGIFFEDEIDPLWTQGYALTPLESRAGGFGNTGMTVRFQGFDSREGANIFRYSWRFDGGLWNLPGYADRLAVPRLLEGKHTLEVMAISQDNMVSAPARLDFVVDTQPPLLGLQEVNESTFITSENPVFVVEASDFQTKNENIRVAYRIDGGNIVDNGFSKVVSPANVPPLEHMIEIMAQDEAGNIGSIEVEFFVDSGRDSFGCGSIGRGGVSQVGTAIVIVLLVTFPIMLILFLKLYYRERREQFPR